MSQKHDHTHDHGHECCGHGHSHEHDHDHGHGHEHAHGKSCCDHDHKHDHAEKAHACCGHDHSHDEHGHHHHHAHAGGCCGHDHDHDHEHSHDHADAEWTRRFFAFLQGVVLLMIGAVMVYFVASGRIDAYLQGWFRILALCGGLGLMVLGAFNWFTGRAQVGCGHDHGEDDCCGEEDPAHTHTHTHSHDGSAAGRALTLLVLSGTIGTAAVLTPDAYTSKFLQSKDYANASDRNSVDRLRQASPEMAKAASQPGGFTLAKVEEYIKRTKEGNFPLSVVNLHYMGADPEYATVMEGQPVETVGQVVKDDLNPGPSNLRVFVMQITCCAADARPYSVPIVFDGPFPDFVERGWYKVRGKLEFVDERGMKMACLKASGKDAMQATIRPSMEEQGVK